MVIANGGEIVLVNASAGNPRWMEWIRDSAQPGWKTLRVTLCTQQHGLHLGA